MKNVLMGTVCGLLILIHHVNWRTQNDNLFSKTLGRTSQPFFFFYSVSHLSPSSHLNKTIFFKWGLVFT
uniref:Uncharacterized protein n=1 Tax=Anguilla anguilla TaxID=7936 RepID=A0A0E9RFG6_ANGAN